MFRILFNKQLLISLLDTVMHSVHHDNTEAFIQEGSNTILSLFHCSLFLCKYSVCQSHVGIFLAKQYANLHLSGSSNLPLRHYLIFLLNHYTPNWLLGYERWGIFLPFFNHFEDFFFLFAYQCYLILI